MTKRKSANNDVQNIDSFWYFPQQEVNWFKITSSKHNRKNMWKGYQKKKLVSGRIKKMIQSVRYLIGQIDQVYEEYEHQNINSINIQQY